MQLDFCVVPYVFSLSTWFSSPCYGVILNSFSYFYVVQASKKIADAKLAKDFQAVLKEFQKAQRLAAERETAYTPFVPQAALPSRYLIGSA